MRRADRLFQIVQLLRHDRVVTANALAEALEVSERTIYRDIQDLTLSGVPIEAQAGSGYRLMKGFHLPPLTFNEEELAALLLGARMVQAWAGRDLAQAVGDAIRKIELVIPERIRPELTREEIQVPNFSANPHVAEQITLLRSAIKQKRKVSCDYTREDGQHSSRTIQPLGLFYWGRVWTLAAWCELRGAFRQFRLDRMVNVELLLECFPDVSGRRLQDFLAACGDAS